MARRSPTHPGPEEHHHPHGKRAILRAIERSRGSVGQGEIWAPSHWLVLDWYPGTDAEHPTEVEIRFVPEGQGTRVTVEHRPLPASAALWKDRAPRYEKSWKMTLSALVEA